MIGALVERLGAGGRALEPALRRGGAGRRYGGQGATCRSGHRRRELQRVAALRAVDGARQGRRAPEGVHAVLARGAGDGRARRARARPGPIQARRGLRLRMPDASRSTRSTCCRARPTGPAACATPGARARPARAARLARVPRRGPGRLRRRRATGRISDATSRLSPYLRFGEIGPRQVWHAAEMPRAVGRPHGARCATSPSSRRSSAGANSPTTCCSTTPTSPAELPAASSTPFPGATTTRRCARWQRGPTGYPIVDAGMRQLWQTGWMHNRVRMIAASFLIKHLLVDWRARRGLVLGHAGRRRPRQQRGELAVGGGLRRRRGALLPHLQSRSLQGEKFDPAGDYVRSVRAGAARCSGRSHPPALGGDRRRGWPPRALRSATPTRARSSITTSARNRALAALETLKPIANLSLV